MSLESDLYSAIQGLVSGRCYPDVAPSGAAKPYITYQVVGGIAENFLESAVVGKRNARMQINCWGETRKAVAALARSVEDAVVVSTALRGFVYGAPVSEYVEDVNLYGTRQDFSIWYSA